jgi:hypothetical protein
MPDAVLWRALNPHGAPEQPDARSNAPKDSRPQTLRRTTEVKNA